MTGSVGHVQFKNFTLKQNFMDGVQLSQSNRTTMKRQFTFYHLVPKTFLYLSTSEGWKAELTLEPPSGFEPRTPGLGIQQLNHKATACLDLPIYFLYMTKNISISVTYSWATDSFSSQSIFHSLSYTKCYSSFRTIKQSKSLVVNNNCGCLILLAKKT